VGRWLGQVPKFNTEKAEGGAGVKVFLTGAVSLPANSIVAWTKKNLDKGEGLSQKNGQAEIPPPQSGT